MTLRRPTVRQTTDDSLLNIKDAKISGAASLANQRPLNCSQQLKAAPPRVTQRPIKCVHMVALMCVWVGVRVGVGVWVRVRVRVRVPRHGTPFTNQHTGLCCSASPLDKQRHTHDAMNNVFDRQASFDINYIK